MVQNCVSLLQESLSSSLDVQVIYKGIKCCYTNLTNWGADT